MLKKEKKTYEIPLIHVLFSARNPLGQHLKQGSQGGGPPGCLVLGAGWDIKDDLHRSQLKIKNKIKNVWIICVCKPSVINSRKF